jgi:hypothetical protein
MPGPVASKKTIITVATKDISLFCDNSSYEGTAQVEGTTGYGLDDETKAGTLRAHKFTCSGTYETAATTTSPRVAVKAILATTVVLTYKPEGSGTGLPLDTFSAVVSKYNESAEVAGMRKWAGEFEITGAVVTTTQP